MDFKYIKQCRVCDSVRLRSYLKLGKQPLANALLKSPSESVEKYPLEVLFCLDCSLSQLSVVIDPETLYADYPYHSSVSETFRKHCQELAKSINRINQHPYKCVVDIACNDGCLLNEFYSAGGFCWLIGVDPSKNLIDEANSNLGKSDFASGRHLEFRQGFWNKDIPIPAADVITALNVFAHVDDVRKFVEAIRHNLQSLSKSFCVIEVPYMLDLLEKNAFDTIYHEHLSYFLFRPIKMIFEACGMRVFKVERLSIHGGSLRVYACLKEYQEKINTGKVHCKDYEAKYHKVDSAKTYPEDDSVQNLEKFEKEKGLYKFPTYLGYAKNFRNLKEKFTSLLTDFRQRGKKVGAYGASAKGISLINYCGITNTDISYIADDTPDKQGKFTPGASIPIVNRDHFDTNHPDYLTLLAWNFSDELMQKTAAYKRKGGQYIVPIPEVKIL